MEEIIWKGKKNNMVNWKGTMVPNKGSIEKLYINYKLTSDETIEILDSIPDDVYIPYVDTDMDLSGFLYCVVLSDGFPPEGLTIFKVINDDSTVDYYVKCVWSGKSYFISNLLGWADPIGTDGFGNEWNIYDTADGPYSNVTSTDTNDIFGANSGINGLIGAYNDKLSEMFSITPFEFVGKEPSIWEQSTIDPDYLNKLFVNEAKAVLPRYSKSDSE